MYTKILKKDLMRKKSINIILFVFILMATTFISGSLSNFTKILSGVDYFIEKAGVGDYFMITMNRYDKAYKDDRIDEFLDNQENVLSYTKDKMVYLSEEQINFADGREIEVESSIIIAPYNIKQQKFFNVDNEEIKNVEEGHIYLAHRTCVMNDIEKGDIVRITTKAGFSKDFVVDGYAKDASLGSDLMGVQRYVLNDKDFEELYSKGKLPVGNIYSLFCDDVDSFHKEYSKSNLNLFFSGKQSLIKTSYIMDMVLAGILIIVSIVLIAISIVMLRFTIMFTLNEDLKEIGIMKAIGMKDSRIRKIYLVKYFVIAVAGGLIGCIASIPFSKILIAQVTENIVVKSGKSTIVFQILISALVVATITAFGYLSTRKIKKISPMSAIRSGNSGERFKKKGKIKLFSTKKNVTGFLAVNDVLSEMKKYIVLLIASLLGIWLIAMPVNTINTLSSEEVAPWFGINVSDLIINSEEDATELAQEGTREAVEEYLDNIKNTLEEKGYEVDKMTMDVMFRYLVRNGDNYDVIFSLQGINEDPAEYMYEEGVAPKYENEVALSDGTAKDLDASVGDTVYITLFDEEKPFVVTAIYQSMNNLGRGMRFPDCTKLDYEVMAGNFGAQIYFKGNIDDDEIKEIKKDLENIYPDKRIETTAEFVNRQVGGIADRIGELKTLILAVVIVINILVVMLMQKMFLVRERGEMAMMKSIGMSNKSIITWQSKRIALVLFIGILLGVLTSTPFTRITSGQVFKFMGASDIKFVINYIEVCVIYPIAVFVATLLACIFTMRKVRKISVQEANNIE